MYLWLSLYFFFFLQLSFDAFNKYVGVYGEEGQSQLRTAIESAKSHYWTGTQFVLNDDWISTLANNKEIKYMSGKLCTILTSTYVFSLFPCHRFEILSHFYF